MQPEHIENIPIKKAPFLVIKEGGFFDSARGLSSQAPDGFTMVRR
jgi:hypothetical protein